MSAFYPDGYRPDSVTDHIDQQGNALTDSGRPGRPRNSHRRENTDAKDHQRIQDNIDDKTAHHADHRHLHSADRLKNFLICQPQSNDCGKQKCPV